MPVVWHWTTSIEMFSQFWTRRKSTCWTKSKGCAVGNLVAIFHRVTSDFEWQCAAIIDRLIHIPYPSSFYDGSAARDFRMTQLLVWSAMMVAWVRRPFRLQGKQWDLPLLQKLQVQHGWFSSGKSFSLLNSEKQHNFTSPFTVDSANFCLYSGERQYSTWHIRLAIWGGQPLQTSV